MKILITSGPTHEPIDSVRYIGNRSSGKMGAALSGAALARGFDVTVISGPVQVDYGLDARVIEVETAEEMRIALLQEWPKHDLLIMAAAVADYRPKVATDGKLKRSSSGVTLELEATPDLVAEAAKARRPDQRVVGFALEEDDESSAKKAADKLKYKALDLVVLNPLETMTSADVSARLIWPEGKGGVEGGGNGGVVLGYRSKTDFADILIGHALALFKTR